MNSNDKATVPAGSILPSVTPMAISCPSGFEAYLAAIGCTKANLKPAKLPTF